MTETSCRVGGVFLGADECIDQVLLGALGAKLRHRSLGARASVFEVEHHRIDFAEMSF
ncbi:MAG: hypothetical protein M3340_08460 [Actinomycetota bacterium]|nr:hypothetical protein [Actinomycetota bacterium]